MEAFFTTIQYELAAISNEVWWTIRTNQQRLERISSDGRTSIHQHELATISTNQQRIVVDHQDNLARITTNQQRLAKIGDVQHELASISMNQGPRTKTRTLVPRSWYQDPGTKILVPRSQVQDPEPRTQNSEDLKSKQDVFLNVRPQNIMFIRFCIIFRGAQFSEKMPSRWIRTNYQEIWKFISVGFGIFGFSKVMKFDLERIHMAQYGLILKLDEALQLRIISGPHLT